MPILALRDQVPAGNMAPFLFTVTWGEGFAGGVIPNATNTGTTIAALAAVDPNGDDITYSDHSDPDSMFSVSGSSLVLATAIVALSSHSAVLRATDPDGAYAQLAITVVGS